MLHRVVFLLKIRYAFSVFMVEPCFVDRNSQFTLTVVQRTVLVVKGLGNLALPGCNDDDTRSLSTMVSYTRASACDVRPACYHSGLPACSSCDFACQQHEWHVPKRQNGG